MDEVTEEIEMDDSGRIVIPADIRKEIDSKKYKLIATKGSIILRPIKQENNSIEDWYSYMKKTELNPKKREDKEKWISNKYEKRKLGL